MATSSVALSPLGMLLRRWRKLRGMSQLDLALEASTSARHISFVETGRSQPSQTMVLRLAAALDVPLREQNALLRAAGYAGIYQESSLANGEMAQIQRALDFMLHKHEPYPAFVLNRYWDILKANAAMGRFMAMLPVCPLSDPPNLLRLLLHPEGLRASIANWKEVAYGVLLRAQRESHTWGEDPRLKALLHEVAAYPGIPEAWRMPDPEAPTAPLVPIMFEHAGQRLVWFTTIATFGTPQDITLQELRIELLFPADAATEEAVTQLSQETIEAAQKR